MKHIVSKQAVRRKLSSDITTLYNGLRFMVSMQTASEQADGTTRVLNGCGFKAKYPTNEVDQDGNRIWRDHHQDAVALIEAAQGSPVNNWRPAHRHLALRLLLGPNGQNGYLRQLTAWANGRKDRASVAEFKLKALYNENSRTHRNYLAQMAARSREDGEATRLRQEIAELKRDTARINRKIAAIQRGA